MKKIIFSSIIGLALIFSSCEKDFDPQIYGSLFSTNFLKTEADLESYLMTCYIPFINHWDYRFGGTQNSTQASWYLAHRGIYRMFDSPSDFGNPWTVGNWGGGWLQISQANFNNTLTWGRNISDSNPSHYEKIRDITRFTEILGALERVGPGILSEQKQKNFTGEVRLLRGLMMYYLYHIYGPVPVIVDPALIGNFEAESNLVRPTMEQMSKFIYDDFDYATKNMVEITSTKGRYTADYARVCLMRHCLNEGSYMSGYYDKAIEMYEALKAKNKYSLYTTGGADAYANQFKQGYKWNSEVIMAYSTSASGDGTNAKGDMNPMWLYSVPDNAVQYADLGNTIPTPFVLQGKGWGQLFNISPEFYDDYEEGDYRKSVILTECWISVGGRTLCDRSNVGVRWSGFIQWKYPVEINQQFQPTDLPLARWADVLLMYAEAVARKTNAIPTGEAMQAITDVRARAGLKPMSGDAVASYDAFMHALLMERGHELLYEGCRKIDLIRFNKYRRNVTKYKKMTPTHQYIPIPNFAVNQATDYGKVLTQFFERPGYDQDVP